MNRKAIFIFLFILLLLVIPQLPQIPAQEIQTLGAFKVEQCVSLKQTCTNCTYVNFSLTAPPSQNIILSDKAMILSPPNLWTFDFCNTTVNGEYIYDTYGDPDGTLAQASVNFFVNPIGKILTSAQATLYFLVFIIALIFFLLCAGYGLYAPGGNTRDEMTGYIIAVSNIKYVKMFMVAIAYLLLMLILYFGYIISYGYLDLDFLGNLLYFAFISMVVLIVPLFIVGVFLLIANKIKDSKLDQMLARGLKVR